MITAPRLGCDPVEIMRFDCILPLEGETKNQPRGSEVKGYGQGLQGSVDMASTQKILPACLLAMHLVWGAAGADTPAPQLEAPAKPAQALTGDAICTRCHDESEIKPILSIYQTKHGVRGDPSAPTCQSCHGVSDNHLKSKKSPPDVTFGAHKSDARAQDAACLTCHAAQKRTRWNGGQHQVNDVSCSSCHTVHAPVDRVLVKQTQTEVCFTCHREQRADSLKVSTHPIDAGKVVCSDCHNAHGSAGPKLLKKHTVIETCYTCHPEKRGPFLWEHQPVTEDCTNCHTPHGSNFPPLLKSRPPFLCQECHDGAHNSPIPYGPGAAVGRPGAGPVPESSDSRFGDQSAAGRACLNCHVMVHGSNAPSGAFLHR